MTVLIPGFVGPPEDLGEPSGGTVTLIQGDPNVIVDTGDVTQRQQLLDALAERGIAPRDIAWVVNTHGHLDHIGNNGLFPGATFVLGADVAQHGRYRSHDFGREPLLIRGGRDDDAIAVIPTPGHTDHDLSVIVTTPIGIVAIAGDLFEHAGDDGDGSWQRWTQDEDRQARSRAKIRAMAGHIVPGHGDIFAVER